MRELRNSYLSIFGWGVFLASALSLGSCSSDETIDAIQGEAITFGDAFVENSTRATDPSYGANANPLTQFQVWGSVTGNTTNSVNLYGGDGATVTGTVGATAWSCSETEYWIPSATYNFMAIANAESVSLSNGMPATISYTADAATTYTIDGSKDLLLAEVSTDGIKTVTTDGAADSSESPVAFTFSHLLSKAVFTFTNTDKSATLTVSNIKMAGLNQKGTYTISGENKGWSSNTAYTSPLEFGGNVELGITNDTKSGTSEHERLIIPDTYKNLIITFTVKDNMGGEDQNITVTLDEQKFLPGYSYNFTAELKSGVKYIVFKIESTEWTGEADRPIQG